MQKLKVAIYGQTTEGYKLAARLVDKASVTLIDETLQMATEVDQRFIKSHPDLDELMSSETLMDLKPIESALTDANVIFFTPKLRRPSEESLIESTSKLRDLSKYVSKGTTVVNALPTGPGGNSENIVLLEKQTGLTVGESLEYAYTPLHPRSAEPAVVASISRGKDGQPLEALGFKLNSQSVLAAELGYVSDVLIGAVKLASEIELRKRAREAKIGFQTAGDDVYLDEFSPHLYELKAIQSSDEAGESISYLAGTAVKSFENYVRYVVDEAREMLKEKELKASRTRIVVLWNLDKYEMRADRLQMAESIVQRLRDYVSDVDSLSGPNLSAGSEILDSQKHNLVIVCSKGDREIANQSRKNSRGVGVSLLSATPGLRRE